LLTLAWAAQMYRFSTGRYSSEASWTLLEKLLQLVGVTPPPSTVSALNTIIRKLAHLIEYAALTLLLYRSLAKEQPLRWRPNLAFWCTGIASIYAMSDEFHQVFVPSRRAAALDWGIDLAGAAFAMFVLHSYCRVSPVRWPRFAFNRNH